MKITDEVKTKLQSLNDSSDEIDLLEYFWHGVNYKQTTLINGRLVRGQGKTYTLNQIAEDEGLIILNDKNAYVPSQELSDILEQEIILVDDLPGSIVFPIINSGRIVVGSYWE